MILTDVLENIRRIIVITNRAECSGFVVDASMRVRTVSSGIAVCDDSVCPNQVDGFWNSPFFVWVYVQV